MRAINSLKAALVATVFAAGAVACPPAWAGPGHGHYSHRHDGHGYWGWGLGLLAGTAIVLAATEPRPVYYSSPTYYAAPEVIYTQPPVVVHSAPPVVLPPAPSAYAEQAWWYYCNQPAGYYPYVKACPSGWTRISPTPPGH